MKKTGDDGRKRRQRAVGLVRSYVIVEGLVVEEQFRKQAQALAVDLIREGAALTTG